MEVPVKPLDSDWLEVFVRESNEIDPQPGYDNAPGSPRWDDHVAALGRAIDLARKQEVADPREIHQVLMGRMWPEIAGKIRLVNVRVGHRICPDYTTVENLLALWLGRSKACFQPEHSNVRPKSPKDRLTIVWQFHVNFEKIHPFRDGNGRTGRLLMVNHAILLGIKPPLVRLIEVSDYYQTFQG